MKTERLLFLVIASLFFSALATTALSAGNAVSGLRIVGLELDPANPDDATSLRVLVWVKNFSSTDSTAGKTLEISTINNSGSEISASVPVPAITAGNATSFTTVLIDTAQWFRFEESKAFTITVKLMDDSIILDTAEKNAFLKRKHAENVPEANPALTALLAVSVVLFLAFKSRK